MTPEDANRLGGPEDPDEGEIFRRGMPWDALVFWIVALSLWGFFLGYGIMWLWRKIVE